MADEGENLLVAPAVGGVEMHTTPAGDVVRCTDEVDEVGLNDVNLDVERAGPGTCEVSCNELEHCSYRSCRNAGDAGPEEGRGEREVAPVSGRVRDGELERQF